MVADYTAPNHRASPSSIADVNTALTAAGIGTKIGAGVDGSRIKLTSIDASVTAFSLTAGSSDPAVKDIGFGTNQTAALAAGVLSLTAQSDLRSKIGRFATDAVFNVSINGGASKAVTVAGIDATGTSGMEALTNSNILDVVSDINRALKNAGLLVGDGDLATTATQLRVDSEGSRLIFTAASSVTSFTVTASAGSTAATELGFPTGAPDNAGNTYDLVIQVRNGSKYYVSLDGAASISNVISAISSATSGNVTVTLNDAKIGLKMTDGTPGTTMFSVAPVNGSQAASGLGIIAVDTSEDENSDGTINGADGDGVIDGLQIKGPTLADRFFIENAIVRGNLSLSTPEKSPGDRDADTNDGVNASATFGGFVSILLHGSGSLSVNLTAGLKDPATGNLGGRITLSQLFDGLGDIGSIVETPALSGSGNFTLGLSIDPPILSLINPGAKPQVIINITDIGNPFETPARAPVINYSFPVLGNLLNFSNTNFNFSAIIDALRSLSGFLHQFEAFGFLDQPLPLIDMSINDVLDFADRLDAAIQSAQGDPANAIQMLDAKLR